VLNDERSHFGQVMCAVPAFEVDQFTFDSA
jgi:hypothetical protein